LLCVRRAPPFSSRRGIRRAGLRGADAHARIGPAKRARRVARGVADAFRARDAAVIANSPREPRGSLGTLEGLTDAIDAARFVEFFHHGFHEKDACFFPRRPALRVLPSR
jgi:hypothetical protein